MKRKKQSTTLEMPTSEQESALIRNRGLDHLRDIIRNLSLIGVGSVLFAVAINGILIPHKFLSGGITGIALIIHYLLPSLPVAWLYFLINVPLFALGWAFVGRRFFYYSIIGMVSLTVALAWVHVTLPIQDKILSALFAGVISGIGGGLILRSRGSAGGTDILSVILLNRFSISIGKTFLAFNIIVLASASVLFSLEAGLYTLIYIYVTSHMVNLVVTGLSKRKAVFIISTEWEEISSKILHKIGRGLTMIHGQGGYTGDKEQILYTVVSLRELSKLKDAIKQADPNAFVVVQDTLEVIGHSIGNQPHW